MYKKTAKSRSRKVLKDHQYMPALNTVSDKGTSGIWNGNKKKKKKIRMTKKEREELKRNTIFGMRFRD